MKKLMRLFAVLAALAVGMSMAKPAMAQGISVDTSMTGADVYQFIAATEEEFLWWWTPCEVYIWTNYNGFNPAGQQWIAYAGSITFNSSPPLIMCASDSGNPMPAYANGLTLSVALDDPFGDPDIALLPVPTQSPPGTAWVKYNASFLVPGSYTQYYTATVSLYGAWVANFKPGPNGAPVYARNGVFISQGGTQDDPANGDTTGTPPPTNGTVPQACGCN